ncbi:MAG: Ppx/GppA family phosphatase [Rhodospirillum sp.]|nr:Ppx/GppA family phosphatase [Rhodospirillum sp.]MCF8492119.1 Ppx/GppA family phosphatase [Rhodospirillum sp.]
MSAPFTAPPLDPDPVFSEDPLDLRPQGIVDIGSNSVRLVVYRGLARTPLPIFNEKATCALGQGLGDTGVLNPEGVEMALRALRRFSELAARMGVEKLDLVATAAVRDAWDGRKFVRALEQVSGHKVTVLTGEQEAKTAALGVLCGLPDADGMVADLGGGSLELVMVDQGQFGDYATMPLGVLRLAEAADNTRARAVDIIDEHLAGLPWLNKGRGRTLYVVGGAWRTLARVCIDQLRYPLHVLDNFSLPREEALRLIDLLSRLSRKSLETIGGINRKRLPHLPMAAVLLERLVEEVHPDTLVFSVYGMREGRYFQSLPEDVQIQDPLLASCALLARSAGRFPEQGEELMDWMAPLFPEESLTLSRLRRAACLISDVFWSEHPDYRAEQSFHRVLKLPFMGLNHMDRAGLALAVFHRYASEAADDWVSRAMSLLDEDRLKRVKAIGYALRLGHTISGGAPGFLKRTALMAQDGKLTLHIPENDPVFLPEVFEKRLDKLAKLMGLSAHVGTL